MHNRNRGIIRVSGLDTVLAYVGTVYEEGTSQQVAIYYSLPHLMFCKI
jgi:hypothetical protein